MVADNCVCFASCKQDRIKSLLMSQHVYSTLLASSEALLFILVYYRSSNSDLQHCFLFLFTKWLKRCKICYICRTHRVPTLLRLFFSFSSSSSPFLAFQRDLFLPPSKPRNFSHKWIRSIIGPDMPSALCLVLKSIWISNMTFLCFKFDL